MNSYAQRELPVAKTMVVVLSLVTVLASATVAGATTSSTPKKWVTTLCTTFLSWEQAVKTGDVKLNKALAQVEKSKHANLKQVRDQLATFLGDFAVASHHARAQMAAVGAPSVPHGAQIQSTVVNALGTAASFLDRAKASVKKFPTNNAAAFIRKTQALSKSITTTFDRVGSSLSALTKYKATQLEAAAKADASCRKLAG